MKENLKDFLTLFGLAVLGVLLSAALGIGIGKFMSTDVHAQNVVGIGQVCTLTTAGNVLVTPIFLNTAPLSPFDKADTSAPKIGPKKIVLSEDLAPTVLICRDSAMGTTCKTIAAVFGR